MLLTLSNINTNAINNTLSKSLEKGVGFSSEAKILSLYRLFAVYLFFFPQSTKGANIFCKTASLWC